MAMLKLGKRPARKGAISLTFGDVFDRSMLPKPPVRIGHEKIGQPWQMFKNDEFGCCVWAGAAHEHMIFTHMGGQPTATFRDDDVLADYGAVTGFKPSDPDSDRGTDMGQAAEYRRKTGIIDAAGFRHKVDAYAALRVGEPDDLAIATYLTGGVGVGIMLPNYAMDQFDEQKPWDVLAKSSGTAGGHYVTCLGRSSAGQFLVISWGRIHAMSPAFYARYSDEAVCLLSLSILRDRSLSPDGFDEKSLRGYLGKLGTSKG